MPRPAGAPPFSGFVMPAYTTTPNYLFDELLPDLNLAETRVLLYVVRHTFGWQKSDDAIGIKQFCDGITATDGTRRDRGTGLSRSTVLAAIKSLEGWGILERRENRDEKGGRTPSTYRLHMAGGPASRTGGSGQPDPQYITVQKKTEQKGTLPAGRVSHEGRADREASGGHQPASPDPSVNHQQPPEGDPAFIRRVALRYKLDGSAARQLARTCLDAHGALRRVAFEDAAYRLRDKPPAGPRPR